MQSPRPVLHCDTPVLKILELAQHLPERGQLCRRKQLPDDQLTNISIWFSTQDHYCRMGRGQSRLLLFILRFLNMTKEKSNRTRRQESKNKDPLLAMGPCLLKNKEISVGWGLPTISMGQPPLSSLQSFSAKGESGKGEQLENTSAQKLHNNLLLLLCL